MSDTVTMEVGPGAGEVHAYVEQVRAALADLPAEDVDDLTIGMEADLGELMAEPGGDLRARLGDPDAYAVELRSAAGLPPRSAPAASAGPWWGARAAASTRAALADLARRFPWLADVRPVWWVVRGVVAGWAAGAVLGMSFAWPLVVAAVAGSFWVGRATPRTGAAVRALVTVGNVLALVLLAPAAARLTEPSVQYVGQPYPVNDPVGSLVVNGEPATSLYAYDADGNRIDRVRLYNQYGQALSVDPSALQGSDIAGDLPLDPATGQPQVNLEVFPLRWGTLSGWETSTGRWAPPVKIVPLPAPTAGSPASSGSDGTSGSTASPTTGASATSSP